MGNGHCHAGAIYYAGWASDGGGSGTGITSFEACKALCMSEPQCTYASSIPGQTCSRYKGNTCIFSDIHKGQFYKHETFKKHFIGNVRAKISFCFLLKTSIYIIIILFIFIFYFLSSILSPKRCKLSGKSYQRKLW